MQRLAHSALGLDGLEQRPRRVARDRRSSSRRPSFRRRDRLTRPSPLSSIRTSCVLRAMRRANASGCPMAQVNGSTVTASAPPSPAAAHAMVRAQHVHPGIAPGSSCAVRFLRRTARVPRLRSAPHACASAIPAGAQPGAWRCRETGPHRRQRRQRSSAMHPQARRRSPPWRADRRQGSPGRTQAPGPPWRRLRDRWSVCQQRRDARHRHRVSGEAGRDVERLGHGMIEAAGAGQRAQRIGVEAADGVGVRDTLLGAKPPSGCRPRRACTRRHADRPGTCRA